MMFNINNHVRVKLNDRGREIHRRNHERLFDFASARGAKYPEYRPPVEDADGWSKWQMWSLMHEFGADCYMGPIPPFDTEIEIIEPQR